MNMTPEQALELGYRAGFISACNWSQPCSQDVDSPSFAIELRVFIEKHTPLARQSEGVSEEVTPEILAVAVCARNKEYTRAQQAGEPRNEGRETLAALTAVWHNRPAQDLPAFTLDEAYDSFVTNRQREPAHEKAEPVAKDKFTHAEAETIMKSAVGKGIVVENINMVWKVISADYQTEGVMSFSVPSAVCQLESVFGISKRTLVISLAELQKAFPLYVDYDTAPPAERGEAQEKAELVYQVRQDATCEWLEVNQAFYDNPTYSKWQHRKLYAAPPAERVRVPEAFFALVEACEANFCDKITERDEPDDSKVSYPEEKCHITFGHIRRARKALAAAPEAKLHG